MAIAFVQSASGTGNGTSPNAILPSNPTQGNLLVAFVTQAGTTETFTPTAGWTKLTEVALGGKAALYYKIAGAGEAAGQTAAMSNSSFDYVMEIAEYSGVDINEPFEVETANTAAASTKTIGSGVNPTDNYERLIIGAAMCVSNNTWSTEQVNGSATGVTERLDIQNSTTLSACLFDKIESAAGAGLYTSAATIGATVNGTIHIAIFRAALTGNLYAKAGTFLTGTGSLGSTVVVTDIGFRPKLVLFWGMANTTAGTASANGRYCFGVAKDSSNQWVNAVIEQNGVAAANNLSYFRSDACIAVLTTSAVDGYLGLTSMDVNGFTLTVNDAIGTNSLIGFIALGGSDISNCSIGTFVSNTGTGNQDITGLGYTPDDIILGASGVTALNTLTNVYSQHMGFLNSTNQAVLAEHSVDAPAVGKSREARYLTTSEAIAFLTSPSQGVHNTAGRGQGSVLNDGFRINWTEAPTAAAYVGYVALKGVSALIGSDTSRTSGVAFSVTGMVAQPVGGIIMSAASTTMVAGTPQPSIIFSVGAFSAALERWSYAQSSTDSVSTTAVSNTTKLDEVLTILTNAGVVNALMDIQSVNSDGVTFVMDDTDVQLSDFSYMLFYTTPSSGQPMMLRGINVPFTRQWQSQGFFN